MPEVRAGHHGDLVYVFEDAGYDATPTDTTMKVFGSNTVMDTFESGHQAARKYNASRTAAEIIDQNFDGAWGASFELSEPPWWLAGVLGQPTSTGTDVDGDGAADIWDYTYDLDNGNNPVSLRLYAPTDGFTNYEMIPGAVIVSMNVDQSQDGSPEISLTGGFAREPVNQSTPSVSIPDFSEATYSNRDAEVLVGGSSLGKAQETSLSVETGTDLVSEIGTGNMVDFSPKALEPDLTYDHIVWVGETVDLLQRFRDANDVTTKLSYDNGQTGSSTYAVEFSVVGSHPNQWSESGRNDPDADLTEELQDLGRDLDVVVTTTEGGGSPPGITL